MDATEKMNTKRHLAIHPKSLPVNYTVIKEASYDRSSFELDGEDRSGVFGETEVQTFGAACERGIAHPILARTFHVYEPTMLIQEAWDQLHLELLKMYEKRYKKGFNLLGLLRDRHFKPISGRWDMLATRMRANRNSLRLSRQTFFIGQEQIYFANKLHVIFTSPEKIELYEQLTKDPLLRKKIKRLEEDILFDVYKGYAMQRFPRLSRTQLDILRQCTSFPLRVDFFCVPKARSRFKEPFYFIEVKGERVKAHTPALTRSQRDFIRVFKGKVGIIILRLFFDQKRVEAKWLVPSVG